MHGVVPHFVRVEEQNTYMTLNLTYTHPTSCYRHFKYGGRVDHCRKLRYVVKVGLYSYVIHHFVPFGEQNSCPFINTVSSHNQSCKSDFHMTAVPPTAGDVVSILTRL